MGRYATSGQKLPVSVCWCSGIWKMTVKEKEGKQHEKGDDWRDGTRLEAKNVPSV